MSRDSNARCGGEPKTNLIRRHLITGTRNVGKPFVYGPHHIPVIIGCAGKAGMSGLNRPARPPIPSNRGAIIISLWTLATHFVEAPTEAGPFIPPLPHKLPRIEMHPPLAIVMDSLPVTEERTKVTIQGRK